jgi:hypothetical protein
LIGLIGWLYQLHGLTNLINSSTDSTANYSPCSLLHANPSPQAQRSSSLPCGMRSLFLRGETLLKRSAPFLRLPASQLSAQSSSLSPQSFTLCALPSAPCPMPHALCSFPFATFFRSHLPTFPTSHLLLFFRLPHSDFPLQFLPSHLLTFSTSHLLLSQLRNPQSEIRDLQFYLSL